MRMSDRKIHSRTGCALGFSFLVMFSCGRLVAQVSYHLHTQLAKAKSGSPDGKVRVYSTREKGYIMLEKVVKTDDEWRKKLTTEQFRVTRMKATELACSGAFWNHHEAGIYSCVCCDLDLFSSDTKFESGTGWPSFWQPVARENLREEADSSLGLERTEVLCARCDAHLGHVFVDGPGPTGLRYCINSVAFTFRKAK